MASDDSAPVGADPAALTSDNKPMPGSNKPTRGLRLDGYKTAEDFAAKGREASGWTSDGQMIMTRFVDDDGLAVPGDDPLYQMLGLMRVFHEEQARQSTENLVRLEKQMGELNAKAQENMLETVALFRDHVADEMDKWRAAVADDTDKRQAGVNKDYDARVGAILASVDAAVAVQRQRERDAAPAAFSAAIAPTLARLEASVPHGSKPGWLLNTMTRDRIVEVALIASVVAGVMALLSFYLIAHALNRL